MSQVFSDKVFYHIYALGMGNCPKRNDFACPAGDFFEKLAGRLDEIRALGCNALLIGPVFESTAHGYDTVDYYHVERRLGNNERFKEFCGGAGCGAQQAGAAYPSFVRTAFYHSRYSVYLLRQ